ncbi:helix-turn-helix domain-containing protein [bacterium]|nr:helix-turn-helix domain-containing protein [bacterium]
MLDYMRELKQSDNGTLSRFHTKYLRCREIEELLKQRKMKRCDIARKLGVNKSTVTRYINDLSLIIPIQEEKGSLYVDKN